MKIMASRTGQRPPAWMGDVILVADRVAGDPREIALGDDTKRADRCQRAALGGVDLVDTVTIPNWSALASMWEVEVLREHVTRVAFLIAPTVARAAVAAAVAVPSIAPIALVTPGIVPVPHVSILSTSSKAHFAGSARGPPRRVWTVA
jgi:hypothetical protein